MVTLPIHPVFLSIIGNDTVKDKNVTVNVTDKTMKKKAEISRRQGSILSLIEINDRITFDEITSKFTVSRRTIARDIASLKKTGILLRVGSDKTGSWLIAKKVK